MRAPAALALEACARSPVPTRKPGLPALVSSLERQLDAKIRSSSIS
jgi:hypothetical protein